MRVFVIKERGGDDSSTDQSDRTQSPINFITRFKGGKRMLGEPTSSEHPNCLISLQNLLDYLRVVLRLKK